MHNKLNGNPYYTVTASRGCLPITDTPPVISVMPRATSLLCCIYGNTLWHLSLHRGFAVTFSAVKRRSTRKSFHLKWFPKVTEHTMLTWNEQRCDLAPFLLSAMLYHDWYSIRDHLTPARPYFFSAIFVSIDMNRNTEEYREISFKNRSELLSKCWRNCRYPNANLDGFRCN